MRLTPYLIVCLFLFPSLTWAAPDLIYLSHRVIDPLGDNDRFPEPGETFNVAVRVQNTGDDGASSIQGTLVPPAPPGVTFIDDIAAFPDLSAGQKTESTTPHFAIGLDAAVACGEPIHLAIRLDYLDSFSQPHTQTIPFLFVVGEATVLYDDDFEFGVGGWDFDAASSTILVPDTDGRWIVANPQGTFSGGERVQPEDDATENGLSCYYTGQNQSGDPYTYDVDGGTSVLLSRPYDLQGRGDVILSYARWFYTDAPGQDVFGAEISNDDGATWLSLEKVLDKQNLWTRTGFRVSDFVPLTTQMRAVHRGGLRNGIARGSRRRRRGLDRICLRGGSPKARPRNLGAQLCGHDRSGLHGRGQPARRGRDGRPRGHREKHRHRRCGERPRARFERQPEYLVGRPRYKELRHHLE
jgi:hypothetical protein